MGGVEWGREYGEGEGNRKRLGPVSRPGRMASTPLMTCPPPLLLALQTHQLRRGCGTAQTQSLGGRPLCAKKLV